MNFTFTHGLQSLRSRSNVTNTNRTKLHFSGLVGRLYVLPWQRMLEEDRLAGLVQFTDRKHLT